MGHPKLDQSVRKEVEVSDNCTQMTTEMLVPKASSTARIAKLKVLVSCQDGYKCEALESPLYSYQRGTPKACPTCKETETPQSTEVHQGSRKRPREEEGTLSMSKRVRSSSPTASAIAVQGPLQGPWPLLWRPTTPDVSVNQFGLQADPLPHLPAFDMAAPTLRAQACPHFTLGSNGAFVGLDPRSGVEGTVCRLEVTDSAKICKAGDRLVCKFGSWATNARVSDQPWADRDYQKAADGVSFRVKAPLKTRAIPTNNINIADIELQNNCGAGTKIFNHQKFEYMVPGAEEATTALNQTLANQPLNYCIAFDWAADGGHAGETLISGEHDVETFGGGRAYEPPFGEDLLSRVLSRRVHRSNAGDFELLKPAVCVGTRLVDAMRQVSGEDTFSRLLNEQDELGRTLLFYSAAWCGNASMLRHLMRLGADPLIGGVDSFPIDYAKTDQAREALIIGMSRARASQSRVIDGLDLNTRMLDQRRSYLRLMEGAPIPRGVVSRNLELSIESMESLEHHECHVPEASAESQLVGQELEYNDATHQRQQEPFNAAGLNTEVYEAPAADTLVAGFIENERKPDADPLKSSRGREIRADLLEAANMAACAAYQIPPAKDESGSDRNSKVAVARAECVAGPHEAPAPMEPGPEDNKKDVCGRRNTVVAMTDAPAITPETAVEDLLQLLGRDDVFFRVPHVWEADSVGQGLRGDPCFHLFPAALATRLKEIATNVLHVAKCNAARYRRGFQRLNPLLRLAIVSTTGSTLLPACAHDLAEVAPHVVAFPASHPFEDDHVHFYCESAASLYAFLKTLEERGNRRAFEQSTREIKEKPLKDLATWYRQTIGRVASFALFPTAHVLDQSDYGIIFSLKTRIAGRMRGALNWAALKNCADHLAGKEKEPGVLYQIPPANGEGSNYREREHDGTSVTVHRSPRPWGVSWCLL